MKIEEIGDGGVEENNVKVQHSRIHAWKFLIYSTSFLHFRHSSSSFHFQIFLFSFHHPHSLLERRNISSHNLAPHFVPLFGLLFCHLHTHTIRASRGHGGITQQFIISLHVGLPCFVLFFRHLIEAFLFDLSFHFIFLLESKPSLHREKKKQTSELS